MKKLFLIILLTSSLFSASIYTLDNVKNLSLYFANSSNFLDKKEKENISKYIQQELEKQGFIFGKTDAITFFVKVDAKELDGTYFINVQLGIAEEVVTKREGKPETFAHTYLASELIESDEPKEDTKELIEFLLSQFIQAYKDDNKE